MPLYIGLVHYPVYNKNEQRIASAVTPVDLHDLARVARTYGARKLLVITPLSDQQGLVDRICNHWTAGFGASYNPHRKKAIELVTVAPSLEDAVLSIHATEGEAPFVLATDANRQKENMLSFPDARAMIRQDRVVFLLFGTAWGLDQEVLQQSNAVLEPVPGVDGYNHLSVRAAAAIVLDRLVGAYP
ncbi:MAG: RNA methyltransferase [Deltaproteobacteria bacterium]|nr:RNA methyltransferase [Deltaproteobacteria bacterium]